MAIKRAVSLYSYQQTYLKGQLDLEGCIKTVVETTGAPGIELIYEQMPIECWPGPVYPNISPDGVKKWHDLMAKYGTTPTCMDSFIDSKIYKGRISTKQEQVQMMEQDLKLASKLGFQCIRVLALVPPEVIEASIPAAEHYGVCMGQEVHARLALDDPWILDVAEIARKHNTKYVGLIPDFGIFCRGAGGAQLHLARVMGERDEVIDYVVDAFKRNTPAGEVLDKIQAMGCKERTLQIVRGGLFMSRYTDPELLRNLMDVIVHFHGKFNYMTEDCNELTINYEDPIRILKEENWDGYIASEYEGQRSYHGQDCPYEADEIEEVRRHHVMLKRLIGK